MSCTSIGQRDSVYSQTINFFFVIALIFILSLCEGYPTKETMMGEDVVLHVRRHDCSSLVEVSHSRL